jgi:glucosamine-6-phosphate deaminase
VKAARDPTHARAVEASMKIKVFGDKRSLGREAAHDAAALIQAAVLAKGAARIVAATGASQFEFLDALAGHREVAWTRVEMFHLDEYVGLGIEHPASFRKYLIERLVVPAGITRYHLLDGETDADATRRTVGRLIGEHPVDVAFVGIGENGHIAFNDPPADFETEDPYLIVSLDDECRRQQVGEGWFACLDDVPTQAISMSVRQVMKARAIVCVVPDARKALAVRRCLAGPVTPDAPSSILQRHGDVTVYLDTASASLLEPGFARTVVPDTHDS